MTPAGWLSVFREGEAPAEMLFRGASDGSRAAARRIRSWRLSHLKLSMIRGTPRNREPVESLSQAVTETGLLSSRPECVLIIARTGSLLHIVAVGLTQLNGGSSEELIHASRAQSAD